MDWLAARQDRIEDALAARHLAGGTLVLYDVSSAAFEGRTCPLGAIGHPKDGVRGRLQIVYGLLTSKEGVPVAIEVFKGNTGDPLTVASQVQKVKERFSITHVLPGGRPGDADQGVPFRGRRPSCGASTTSPCCVLLRSGPSSPRVERPARSLFDETDLFEIAHPDYEGERLVCCKNPLLADERSRKRASLLSATEAELQKIADAVSRECWPLRGADKIALLSVRPVPRQPLQDGEALRARGSETTLFSFSLEAAFDRGRGRGRRDLRAAHEPLRRGALGGEGIVFSYKSLSSVERAFRAFNTDLDIRPIRHRSEERVRADCFLRMLSYYVTFHMERAACADALQRRRPARLPWAARTSPVAPAVRSSSALSKVAKKNTRSTSSRCTAFRACSPTLPRSAANKIHADRPRTCPASPLSPRPLRCSVEPSSSSASPSISATRSQKPPQHHAKDQVNGHARGSPGGTSG